MSLKHWWQLNGSLVDCVGGNNLVASSGFSSNDSGKIGRCYFASTTSAYAESTTEIYRDGDLSLCFWFKLTAYASSPTGLVTLHSHSDTSNIGINLGASNKLAISIGYTDASREWSGKNSAETIALNTWYHACVTFEKTANKISVYLNGVREHVSTLTKEVKFLPKKLSVNRWSIGYSSYMSTCYYNDIRFYDHALSAKEVKEISKGLMLHYNFNNIVGTNVRDNSGFKNHATFGSGAAPSISTQSGTGSASLLFKNNAKQSNGYYQHVKSNSTVYIPVQGTLSYYIKYDTANYAENGDNKYAVGYANFCSMNNPSALGMIYYYDASNYTTTTTTSNNSKDGNWHMHTISWNKETKAFKNYLDGALVQSATATGFQHAGTFRNFIVGSAWDLSYGGHSGYLDDVRVYATQLSDNDVAELYKVKGSVSKNGKLFANEICELGFKTKTAYDATWARIFYHNIKSGAVVFSNDKEEFLNCYTADKQSNLWALDKFKNKDGKIELLLEYDGITGYNRWKQSSNFTKETAISGYEAVAVSWTGSGWNGLALSQDSGTWVDGSPNSGASSWWYAIGCKTNYQGGIPGPNTTIATGGLSLWARIDNLQTNSIDKQGVLYTNEIVEVDNCSMKTKTENNANWVRLFYHNSKSGTVLFNKNNKAEFLKCHTADKQSDLWALEQFRGKDGKFELLLQYQNSTGYNRWKQSSNFTKEKIAGYEAVQVSWTANYWGGLETDGTNTFVDGSVNHGNWFYAIGPFSNYSNGMPGPNGAEAGWVEIWVRCDDINLFRMIKNGKCKATEFIEI